MASAAAQAGMKLAWSQNHLPTRTTDGLEKKYPNDDATTMRPTKARQSNRCATQTDEKEGSNHICFLLFYMKLQPEYFCRKI